MPEALDKRNSPAAGTGAGGTNYSHGSGYDTGDSVKGYMGTQDVVSSGQGYMTTPLGAGPGFGVNNEGFGHNTGIGVSGAGTGTSGYHHGTGALITMLLLAWSSSVRCLCNVVFLPRGVVVCSAQQGCSAVAALLMSW